MESLLSSVDRPLSGLSIRMLGPLALKRDGAAVTLPPSRKVRALLAYLALAAHPVGRSRLCELLGDIPNDPRGELRWCLSKLRAVLDDPSRARVSALGDMISLDLANCSVDAVELEAAVKSGLAVLDLPRLRALCDLFIGDFMEGLDLNRSPQLDHWLASQRRRYRACQSAILEQLTKMLPEDAPELRAYAERWVGLSPFDARAQILLLKCLAGGGRPSEGERHLIAIVRMFEAEELDAGPLRQAWRELRDRQALPSRPVAAAFRPDAAPAPVATTEAAGDGSRRASLAVMPFAEPDRRAGPARLADGLTHDIITRLAKLRSLFVIARGSVFALADRGIGAEEAAKLLNVDYSVSGVVQRHLDRTVVMVELVEARSARIVWSDGFDLKSDEAFAILDRIGDRIVASIANEIETAEKNRAILKPPNSLNAWESYHRGLWHVYRFTMADNDLAQTFFRRAAELDPTFARAHAGLSFTHWQKAFQRWGEREQEAGLAFEAAGRSLLADDHDPAAHYALGRALWLRGRQEQSVAELETAVALSPNFALGHYALSFVHSQSGDPATAIASSDHSRSLSPFAPLLFGMLGVRAMAHVRLGQYDEAAEWASRAAARPNAHLLILAIAAHCLALADRLEEARGFAAAIRKTLPDFRVEDFLTTFRFSPETETQFRKGAVLVGLD